MSGGLTGQSKLNLYLPFIKLIMRRKEQLKLISDNKNDLKYDGTNQILLSPK